MNHTNLFPTYIGINYLNFSCLLYTLDIITSILKYPPQNQTYNRTNNRQVDKFYSETKH